MNAPRLPLAGAVCLLAAAACGGNTPDRPPRHLVLVSVDALRADHLGCYGSPPAGTGTFDRLAAEGVVADRAIAPTPVSLPSHATLLTGIEPWRLDIWSDTGDRLAPRFETLAERLHSAGFDTAAIVGGAPLASGSGIEQGFEFFDDAVPLEDESPGGRSAASVTDAAIAWIAARSGDKRRRFLFVHYFDPHAPYAPPERYATAAGAPSAAPGFTAYRGEIAYVDDQLERLLAALSRSGWLDETLLIVTSDHGEGLMQHGELMHGLFLYDEVVRVPLILAFPGLPAGRRLDPVIALADVVPTVLDALGLGAPGGLDGRSFWPLATGTGGPAREYAFSASRFGLLEYGWAPLRAVRTRHWKYVDAPDPELYHLDRDPGETKNRLVYQLETAAWLDEMIEHEFAAEGGEAQAALPGRESAARPDPKGMVRLQQQLQLASYELAHRRHRSAERRLREIVARDPGNLAARCLLAEAWVSLGLADQAERALRQALEVARDDPRRTARVLAHLVRVEERRGRYERALGYCDRLDAIAPGNGETVARRAELLAAAGRDNEAIALLEGWLREHPRSPSLWRLLARTAERLGEERRRREAWSRVLELWPDDREAQRAVATAGGDPR